MRNKKVSVLIVDDHPIFVDRMTTILCEVENVHQIDRARNYNEALQLLEQEKHDVVLLDISLPDRNGMELLEQIQQKSWECKVIMLSNLSANYYVQECKRLGASYFLDKSRDFELVPEIISSVHLN